MSAYGKRFICLHGTRLMTLRSSLLHAVPVFINHKNQFKMQNLEIAQDATNDNVTTQDNVVNEAKSLKIIAFQVKQSDTDNTLNVEQSHEIDVLTSVTLSTTVTDVSASKVCGTALNELFEFVNMQRTIGAKGLRLDMPINLKFEIGDQVINTATWEKSNQAMLKLQNNAAGRRSFAVKFWTIFSYSIKPIKEVDMSDLLTELKEKAAIEAQLQKDARKAIADKATSEASMS